MDKIHSILLIDDDPVSNFIHEEILDSLQISDEVRIATNGKEALEMIMESCNKGNCPQLILLDLNMPVMDGFEFIEEYKKLHLGKDHDSKIVILSSSSSSRDIERAKNLEVTDYLVKPLNEKKIEEWIQNFFNNSNR